MRSKWTMFLKMFPTCDIRCHIIGLVRINCRRVGPVFECLIVVIISIAKLIKRNSAVSFRGKNSNYSRGFATVRVLRITAAISRSCTASERQVFG